MDIFREEPEKNWAQGLNEAIKPVADTYLKHNLDVMSKVKTQQMLNALKLPQQLAEAQAMAPLINMLMGGQQQGYQYAPQEQQGMDGQGTMEMQGTQQPQQLPNINQILSSLGMPSVGSTSQGLGQYLQQPTQIPQQVMQGSMAGQQPYTQQTSQPQQQDPMQQYAQQSAQIGNAVQAAQRVIPGITSQQLAMIPVEGQRRILDYAQKAVETDLHRQDTSIKTQRMLDRKAYEQGRLGNQKASDIYDKIAAESKTLSQIARESYGNLGNIIDGKLANLEGNLTSQGWATLLDKMGLGNFIGATDSRSAEYQANVKSTLGMFRVLFPHGKEIEFKAFLDALPTLMNTPEGRDKMFDFFLKEHARAIRTSDIYHREARKFSTDTISYDAPIRINDAVNKGINDLFKTIRQDGILSLPEFADYVGAHNTARQADAQEQKYSQQPIDTTGVRPLSNDNMPQGPTDLESNQQLNPMEYLESLKRTADLNRQAAVQGARGAVGDLERMIISIPIAAQRGVAGMLGKSKMPWASELRKLGNNLILPTYSEIKEEERLGNEGPISETLQNVIGRITNAWVSSNLLSGGSWLANKAGQALFGRTSPILDFLAKDSSKLAVKGALYGETGKNIPKVLGMSKGWQSAGDILGTSFALLPEPKKNLQAMVDKFYPESKAVLSDIQVSMKPFIDEANGFIEDLRGIPSKESKEVIDILQTAVKNLNNTETGSKLIQQDQILGQVIGDLPKKYKYIGYRLQDAIENIFNTAASTGGEAIGDAVNKYRTARSAYSALASGSGFKDFVVKYLPTKLQAAIKSPVAGYLGLPIAAILGPKKLALGLAGAAGVHSYNIIKSMARSPEAQKQYLAMYKAYLANSPSMLRSVFRK